WTEAAGSICHPQTRIWIYQGIWCRNAKLEQRLLRASGWRIITESSSERERKLVNWGMLVPKNETKIVLKGQWLRKDGKPLREPPKKYRAVEVSWYGF